MHELTCPDGGICHHRCEAKCFRVQHCGPLSGTFTDDDWPTKVRELHAAESAEVGETSDGFHTFNELYDHRSALFIALMLSYPTMSWAADLHEDGSMFDGFFIVGMNLPTGQVTYHLKRDPWFKVLSEGEANIRYTTYAPTWDGHSPAEALKRIVKWTAML